MSTVESPSTQSFFDHPVVNSPYEYPGKHWALDDDGQPTGALVETRRVVDFVTPIPQPKKSVAKQQQQLDLDDAGISDESQKYEHAGTINEVRRRVDEWRRIPDKSDWRVTPETARLLEHWRTHEFMDRRPFFCQVEAVETAIWLTEVAPTLGKQGQQFIDHLAAANEGANPDLARLALKLATGAGKTAVMAMLIAWQTVNAVRRPTSSRYSRGFIIVTPGITIKDRLRVLQPNDPESLYDNWELVPREYLRDLERAHIVITNYHAFKLRETADISKGGRQLLQGRSGEPISTLETEGQMLKRVMPGLMGLKNVLAINDEAHHCYRTKPGDPEEEKLKGEDKKEADKNAEAARLWINGLETVDRHLGLNRVFDLSATPFFLRGSGYVEGTLFPWVMSDFSLMDAIECGIVKLPRVPVTDDIAGPELPMFRNLWAHIANEMPKKGRGKAGELNPKLLPTKLKTAIDALYGHYEETFRLWEVNKIDVPPCFIIVCNNTSASKLVSDYVSGYWHKTEDGDDAFVPGRLELFRNFDDNGNPFPRPSTLLVDSEQLESGEALDSAFASAASAEIEHFRREIIQRTGDQQAAANIADQDLLREVMNTVGKKDRLGESVRCVVSVSMLTEGWDTNTVTHVLGVRAFQTQLLCEQVVGRALRRQSYDLSEDGLLPPEYADVFGVPFDFTANPVIAPPQPPRPVVHVRAVSPERDDVEITFPNVIGYRAELPPTKLTAEFDDNSTLVLTTDFVGASKTLNSGLIGEAVTMDRDHLSEVRSSTVLFHLTKELMERRRTDSGDLNLNEFGALKKIVRQWLDVHLVCRGNTFPAEVLYHELAQLACERIEAGIRRSSLGETHKIRPLLDQFNPIGSSRGVSFTTSKPLRWTTDASRSHVNYAICDSQWELEFCRVIEQHEHVVSYVRNQSLGFEIPYSRGISQHRYLPDFIVVIDDGHGPEDLLHLTAEVKGYRGEDVKDKENAVNTLWLPSVNGSRAFGRWAFAEFSEVLTMEKDFDRLVAEAVDEGIADAVDQANKWIPEWTLG